MGKRIAILLAALLIAAAATAQVYHPGESLQYRVSYRAKLFPNTEVATVTIDTSRQTENGEEVYKVVGNGKTMSVFRWFFSLDDTYTLTIDPQTLRTNRFESDIREGSYTFRSEYIYDWQNLEVRTRWQSRQNPQKTKTMKITEKGMDPVSLYFNLRSVDTDAMRQGDSQSLEMVLEDTIRTLDFRFLGREIRKIPKRGKFRTLKFACQIGTSDGFSFTDGTEFTVWISDDRNKIPLYIESPIRVGSIQAYISSFSGLKYPLDCRSD